MATTDAEIEAKGPDLWVVRAIRVLNGASATCDVVVKQHEKPSASASPHEKLAGSNAWLALGEKLLEADDVTGAITCAREGLDELGKKYALQVLKMIQVWLYCMQQIRLSKVGLRMAPGRVLRTLKNRVSLYQELHAATLEN